ncbi:hypothetical protein DYB26_007029 [Aphanomyces astaci]|uniref:MIF4G domain-containing protein n=1 Tax=Aphanomyces astaci TaxID=112090 RepID=A0A397FUF1_APHAT|nr:hypothetical protein DYB26_007029 [Aphanomyces astaci]RHZ40757.1 hypothetical protein DYB31_003105 [Aphanomyces astaci]
MSSKLNPKAGAFVPSFVVPVEVVITPALTTTVVAPSPGGSKKNKGNGTSTHNPLKSTRQPVTMFRPFFTAVPPHFDLAGVNATCGGTVKEKTKSAAKRDKQRAAAAAAAAQPVLHYDPNAYAYFPTVDPDHKKDKQPRHTPTESPEDEMNDAVANVNSHFYAPFCSGLSDTLPDFKDGARTVNFRRILLTKCYEALVEEPDHAVRSVGDLLDGSSPASRRTMDEYFDALQRVACRDHHLPPQLTQLIQEVGSRLKRGRVDGYASEVTWLTY